MLRAAAGCDMRHDEPAGNWFRRNDHSDVNVLARFVIPGIPVSRQGAAQTRRLKAARSALAALKRAVRAAESGRPA